MTNTLKMIFVNVNSIVSRHRRHYLNLFLMEHKPDVMLLAEHHLSSRHRFDVKGYKVFRRDRLSRRGGGTAVLVRDRFRCEEVVLDTGAIESTAVCIRRVNGSDIIVVSMYLCPGVVFTGDFFNAVQHLAVGSSVIIGADLNARHPYWGDPFANESGRNLKDFLLASPDLDIRPTEGPTRSNAVLSSYIDFFLTTVDISMAGGDRLRTLDYESDHRAVEMVFSTGECVLRGQDRRYDYDRIDVRKFRRVLAGKLADCGLPVDRNVSRAEIDETIGLMCGAFTDAIDGSVPKVSTGRRGLLRLPPYILGFIEQKKRLRRTMYRCGDPGRRNILKAEVRNLDRIIQGAIAVFERDYWSDFLGSVRLNNRTFRNVKMAAGLNARPVIRSLVGANGTIVSDESGKADLLAGNFSRVHLGGQEDRVDPFSVMVKEVVSSLDGTTPLATFGEYMRADGGAVGTEGDFRRFGFIDSASIGDALRRRSNKRSSGVDGVPEFVLRKTGTDVWGFLSILFNHCLNVGYFPTTWKEAVVVPVLKPGSDPGDSESYRPISLLSAFGKLFEYFILARINDVVLDRDILMDNQFGFRTGLSTSHALMVFADYVAKGLNNRCPTMAVSLDFSRAFDTVWQDGIVYKLMNMGFDTTTCRMIGSFLTGRKFRVRLGDILSEGRPVSAGVPQGSLLAPVLYNLYISDIPQPSGGELLLIYADDILVASSGPRAVTVNNRLNGYLSNLTDYFTKWGLRLNVRKTVALALKGKRRHIYPNWRKHVPCLMVGGEPVPTSDRMKYLGVTFHGNFEYCRHVDNVLLKSKRIFSAYQSVLRRRGGLDRRIRLLVYRQVIRPIVSYAFPSWFGISSWQMERLRRWERRVLTACLGMRTQLGPDGVPRKPSCASIYGATDFCRLDVFMTEGAIRFLERARSLENSLVRGCFNMNRDLETVRLSRYFSPTDLLTLRDAGLLFEGADLLFYHRRINRLDNNDTVYNTAQ